MREMEHLTTIFFWPPCHLSLNNDHQPTTVVCRGHPSLLTSITPYITIPKNTQHRKHPVQTGHTYSPYYTTSGSFAQLHRAQKSSAVQAYYFNLASSTKSTLQWLLPCWLGLYPCTGCGGSSETATRRSVRWVRSRSLTDPATRRVDFSFIR